MLFRTILPKTRSIKIFLENSAISVFSYHKTLHSYKTSEKSNEPFVRKTVDRQTDRQADGCMDKRADGWTKLICLDPRIGLINFNII